jgi:intracellular sulfur oxidation DsrE/DsrF family protein
MDRRNIFKTALMGMGGVFALKAASSTGAAAATGAAAEGLPKVAYHLADIEKAGFVLNSIRHHFEGMGGQDKVKIVLVVHGNALWAFRTETPNFGFRQEVREMVGAGLELHACAHTMDRMRLRLEDLLPGFAVAEKGAVVKLAALQGEGFAYLRP